MTSKNEDRGKKKPQDRPKILARTDDPVLALQALAELRRSGFKGVVREIYCEDCDFRVHGSVEALFNEAPDEQTITATTHLKLTGHAMRQTVWVERDGATTGDAH